MEMHNGNPDDVGVVYHHCGFGCKCTDPKDTERRMVESTTNYMFGYRCPPPSDDWEGTRWIKWPGNDNEILFSSMFESLVRKTHFPCDKGMLSVQTAR